MKSRTLQTVLSAVMLAAASCTSETPASSPSLQPEHWTLVTEEITATVYNAQPQQCDGDWWVTATNRIIDTTDITGERILAIERTMLDSFPLLDFGMQVYIEGTGVWDGLWTIDDKMNRRFRGQRRIDLLVPNNIRHGKWTDVRMYVPTQYVLKSRSNTGRKEYQFADSMPDLVGYPYR